MALFFEEKRMLSEDVTVIKERFKNNRIELKDALAVLDMILADELQELGTTSPHEVFKGLGRLIDRTVHGVKINRFRPGEGRNPFHCLEIYTESGDILGHLNMIYLRKPIPCYYLVYVEVLPSFRNRGLGNKILKVFREFVEKRRAVGLLDNIIPPDEPTYEIYTKLGWECIREYIGDGMINGAGNYMVCIPGSIQTPDLRSNLTQLLFNLKKKRPVIDMHDNEDMVQRTIGEFRSVYEVLVRLFDAELSSGTVTPLMRFMFTKFTTKLIGFRRRIAALVGYTGGESLEQISLSGPIKELTIQPYSLWNLKEDSPQIRGAKELLEGLPSRLREEPTLFIEELLLYRRPYLISWMEKTANRGSDHMKIADLLGLGFDPTRLREFQHRGIHYIFERLSPDLFRSLEKKKRCLMTFAECTSGRRFHRATVKINPPLVAFKDRANLYVMRRKIEGIHLQEALDQLRTAAHLVEMNRVAGLDRAMVRTINDIKDWLVVRSDPGLREEIEELAYFVPWDIPRNTPKVQVDVSGVVVDTVWIT
jgi:GNAT superfamily N-acetyltransferase